MPVGVHWPLVAGSWRFRFRVMMIFEIIMILDLGKNIVVDSSLRLVIDGFGDFTGLFIHFRVFIVIEIEMRMIGLEFPIN